MENRPFHYSYLVTDLASTRRFYSEIFGFKEGRSTATWIDFDFFGNQISAHVAKIIPPPSNSGHVDNVAVPIPHFGALLPLKQFYEIAERLKHAEVRFIIEPMVRFKDQPSEQATIFLTDFSGNAIEFKSFTHEEHIFTL